MVAIIVHAKNLLLQTIFFGYGSPRVISNFITSYFITSYLEVPPGIPTSSLLTSSFITSYF